MNTERGIVQVDLTQREMTGPQRWALAAIESYQRSFAGRPSPCRFFPSCSHYAHEAIEVHGTSRGLALTMRRLSRCRPFGPSGFDPVPEARDDTDELRGGR